MNCMWPAAWVQLRLSYSQPKLYNKLKMEKSTIYYQMHTPKKQGGVA